MGNTRQFLGARIQEIRKQKGIKQAELAEMIEIDPKHMSKIECGRCYPSFEVLDRISEKLNIPVSYFLETYHLKTKNEPINLILVKLNNAGEDKIHIAYKILREIL